jgi:hypothetical protein
VAVFALLQHSNYGERKGKRNGDLYVHGWRGGGDCGDGGGGCGYIRHGERKGKRYGERKDIRLGGMKERYKARRKERYKVRRRERYKAWRKER